MYLPRPISFYFYFSQPMINEIDDDDGIVVCSSLLLSIVIIIYIYYIHNIQYVQLIYIHKFVSIFINIDYNEMNQRAATQ